MRWISIILHDSFDVSLLHRHWTPQIHKKNNDTCLEEKPKQDLAAWNPNEHNGNTMTRVSRRHHEEATSLQPPPAAMGNSTGVIRCWLSKVECCLLGGYRMTGVSRATCYSCFLADLLGTCTQPAMMDGADARKSPFVTEMECNLILLNIFAIYCNPRAALTFFSNEGWFGNVSGCPTYCLEPTAVETLQCWTFAKRMSVEFLHEHPIPIPKHP